MTNTAEALVLSSRGADTDCAEFDNDFDVDSSTSVFVDSIGVQLVTMRGESQFGGIIFPSDIRTLQQDLLTQEHGLDQTVSKLRDQGKIDATRLQQWGAESANVEKYAAIDVGIFNTTGGLYDQGKTLQGELNDWSDTLAKLGGETPPKPDPNPTSGFHIPWWAWAAGGVVIIGGLAWKFKGLLLLPVGL